jgi:hypothetical protein
MQHALVLRTIKFTDWMWLGWNFSRYLAQRFFGLALGRLGIQLKPAVPSKTVSVCQRLCVVLAHAAQQEQDEG